MDGFADLGALLAGQGKQDYAQAYSQAMSRRQQTELAMTKARIARDEELARAETEAVLGQVMAPEEAAVLATIGRAGFNPSQFSRARIDNQKRELADLGMQMLEAGDIQGARQYFSAAKGEVPTQTKISGNTAFDPALPPNQALYATPLGGSMIDANMARAGASRAQAGASTARADLYGRTDPNIRKAPKAGPSDAPAVNIQPSTVPAVQGFTPSAPYQDGTVLQGPDGALYVVRNGVPVKEP